MTKEQSANMLDKGMIHFRGWGEWNQKAGRSHSVTQSGAQFKIYELFISEIFFHLVFSYCSWLRGTVESETWTKGTDCMR